MNKLKRNSSFDRVELALIKKTKTEENDLFGLENL